MFNHYLKIALRNIRKYVLQNTVSMIGLVAGFVAFALSSLWMGYVDSYDSYHKDADRIYTFSFNEDGRTVIGNERTRSNGDMFYSLFRNLDASGQLDAIGVESFMHFDENQGGFEAPLRCYCIDSTFMDYFNPVLLEGDWSFMEDPSKVAISKSRAKQDYGDEDPLGKDITQGFYKQYKYTITAVVDNFDHSFLDFDYLRMWNGISIYYYKWLLFKLKEGVTVEEMLNRCAQFFESDMFSASLEHAMRGKTIIPLTEVYKVVSEQKENCYVKYSGLDLLSKASLLLLLCAIVNHFTFFLNYLRGRRREMVLRKVNGASTGKIAAQMVIESIIPVLMALLLGLLAVVILKEPYMELADIGMADSYYLKGSIFIVVAVMAVSVIIGLAEVLFINRHTMQSVMSRGNNNLFRKISIGIQITSGMMFMFALMVMYYQFSYMRNLNWGTKRKDVAIVNFPQKEPEKEWLGTNMFRYVNERPEWGDFYLEKLENRYGLKARIEALPCVNGVYMNFADMSISHYGHSILVTATEEFADPLFPDVFDYIYPELTDRLGLTVLQGSIPEDGIKDDEVVLTDNLFKALGGEKLEDMPVVYLRLGRSGTETTPFKIMAIVNNIHLYHYDDIPPYILLCGFRNKYLISEYSYGEERGSGTTEGELSITYTHNGKKELEASLKELFDELGIEYKVKYPEESFFGHLAKDKHLSTLLLILCITSIIIAMFGIWSHVTLTCTERKREIAIRKAHGAKVRDILNIFSREYGVIFLISSAVALMTGYLVMKHWQQQFYYQATISWWIYLAVILFTATVIVVTVINRVLKTARENPADVIKSE
ncbi:MAG: ABC transporter permease [Bacteroidaceae bacterium]|nr:ABC transporter permease [Bacteroidaceae bacterium]